MKHNDTATAQNHSADAMADKSLQQLKDMLETECQRIETRKATYRYSIICVIIIAVAAAVYIISINHIFIKK